MIDHLWQSTLFAVVIALMMPLFARQSAGLRFWLWFAASVKFLFPFSLLVWLGGFLPALPEQAPLLAARSLVLPPVLIAPPAELMPATQILWALWAAGALFLGVRWLVRWWSLRAALRGAPDLGVEAPVPVKAVASFLEPQLFAASQSVGRFGPLSEAPSAVLGGGAASDGMLAAGPALVVMMAWAAAAFGAAAVRLRNRDLV